MTVLATFYSDKYSAVASDCMVKADSGHSSPVVRILSKLETNMDNSAGFAFCGSEIIRHAVHYLLSWEQTGAIKLNLQDQTFLENTLNCGNLVRSAYENAEMPGNVDPTSIHIASRHGISIWRIQFGPKNKVFWSGQTKPILGKKDHVEVFHGGEYQTPVHHTSSLEDYGSVFKLLIETMESAHQRVKDENDGHNPLGYEFDGHFTSVIFDRESGECKYLQSFKSLSDVIFGGIGEDKNLTLLKDPTKKWNPS